MNSWAWAWRAQRSISSLLVCGSHHQPARQRHVGGARYGRSGQEPVLGAAGHQERSPASLSTSA